MLNFEEIKTDNQRIQAELEKRNLALQDAFQSDFAGLDVIPRDLYDPEQIADGGLEAQFKQLTFGCFPREFNLYLDLSNALTLLNRIQAVALTKQKQALESRDVAEEGVMNGLFFSATVREAEKTLQFRSEASRLVSLTSAYIEHFGVECPSEEGEITRYCREIESNIHDDMTPELFSNLQNEIFARICDCCNKLTEITLEKVDVELGYLFHRDAAIDAEELERKSSVFSSMMTNASNLLGKSIDYLEGIQMFHSPASLFDPNIPKQA